MTTKERVLDYFEKWDGKGDNPANGCEATVIFAGTFADQYQIHIDGVLGWVWNIDQKRPDEHFEFAARILQINNPWRLASEELPERNEEVLACWGRGSRGVAFQHGGLWYSGGCCVISPTHWMPIPDNPERQK